MKEAGGLLIAFGILLLIVAFFVTTSSQVSYTPSLNPYLPPMPSDVANLYGMHVQAITFQGGFAAIISGAVLFGFGTVDETLKRNAAPLPKPAPPPPPPPPAPVLPAYDEPEIEEKKPDRSMIWIAVVGLGVVALIIVAMLAAQRATPMANNVIDNGSLGTDMNMDTNMELPHFDNRPAPRSHGRR